MEMKAGQARDGKLWNNLAFVFVLREDDAAFFMIILDNNRF
jgi:hypothetical protein